LKILKPINSKKILLEETIVKLKRQFDKALIKLDSNQIVLSTEKMKFTIA
jgi:hypothetical protein